MVEVDLWQTILIRFGQEGKRIALRQYCNVPPCGRNKLLIALALSRECLHQLLAEEKGQKPDPVAIINMTSALYFPLAEQVDARILLGRHISIDLPEEKLDEAEVAKLNTQLEADDTSAESLQALVHKHVFLVPGKISLSNLCGLPGIEIIMAKIAFSLQGNNNLKQLFEEVAADTTVRTARRVNGAATESSFLDRLKLGLLSEGTYATNPTMFECITRADHCANLAAWLKDLGLETVVEEVTKNTYRLVVNLPE